MTDQNRGKPCETEQTWKWALVVSRKLWKTGILRVKYQEKYKGHRIQKACIKKRLELCDKAK